jgi:membrane carboxypeptidase/penicillin-binding protein PbpC
MQRLKNLAVSIAILALVALPSPTSSQNERNPNRCQAKLRKVKNKILNRYIVVLNDDVPAMTARVKFDWNAYVKSRAVML